MNLTMTVEQNAITICRCEDCATEFWLSPPPIPGGLKLTTR
jgi:hypothetical protein